MHTGYAGDYVDNALIKEIQSKYNGAQITKDMARRWKEQFSFVSTAAPDEPVLVDFSIEGKAKTLTSPTACSVLANPSLTPSLRTSSLIAGSNPEYHTSSARTWSSPVAVPQSRASVPSSKPSSDMGDVNVHVVDDPVHW